MPTLGNCGVAVNARLALSASSASAASEVSEGEYMRGGGGSVAQKAQLSKESYCAGQEDV